MDTSLSEIIYCSRKTPDYKEPLDSVIRDILTVSRGYNEDQDITGVLLATSGYFTQILEGPSAAVEQLFASIRSDPRHHDVVLLSQRLIASRISSDWAMGFIAIHDEPAIAAILANAFVQRDEAAANAVRTMLEQTVSRSKIWGYGLPTADT